MAVCLRNAHIDRKICASRKLYIVIDHNAPSPINFGQTIDTKSSTKAATFECNLVVQERREPDFARHDVCVETKSAAACRIKPDIDAGKVAGRHRRPS